MNRETRILIKEAEDFCKKESTDGDAAELIGKLLSDIESKADEIDSLEEEVGSLEDSASDDDEPECENPFENLEINFNFSKMTLDQQIKIEEFFNTQL